MKNLYKYLAILPLAVAFQAPSYAVLAGLPPMSLVQDCASQPTSAPSVGSAAASNFMMDVGYVFRVPIDPSSGSSGTSSTTPPAATGGYQPTYADNANASGVTIYSDPVNGDCAWNPQNSNLGTSIAVTGSLNPQTDSGSTHYVQIAFSFDPSPYSPNAGTPGQYGTEHIIGMFTDTPIFQAVSCETQGGPNPDFTGYVSTSPVACSAPFNASYDVEYGGSSGNQPGLLNLQYFPSQGVASGTEETGNVIFEVQNDSGVGYYYAPVSAVHP